MIKKEIRVVGIDDSPFNKFKDRTVLVIATFFRGGSFLDGIMTTRVRVDGINSTKKIADMLNSSKFNPQVQALLLDGIAVGGFNIIDTWKLNRATGTPVIVIIRNQPDLDKIKRTLKKLGMEKKIKLIDQAGIPERFRKIFFQAFGINQKKAREILDLTCTRSFIPEPVRCAHLIGAGVVKGESRGRA